MKEKKERDIYCQKFGLYIKTLRKLKGMKQIDLADKLGNSAQNVSTLEQGQYSPTLIFIDRLAKAFEISMTELINGFEESLKEVDSVQEN